MGNTITSECYPEVEALDMSNGLTGVLYSTMSMATGLLATTPWEVRLARWWCTQDQASSFAGGYGDRDFDLDELGWTAECWPEQRRFLLNAVRFARAGARWLVTERVNFAFLDWALGELLLLVEVIDARILGPRPPSEFGLERENRLEEVDAATVNPSEPAACRVHGCYLHGRGCIACHTLGPDSAQPWRSQIRHDIPPPDAPWVVAARDGIPVRRHVRQMTRRSFEPHILASLRPKSGPWKVAYDHVLAAFDADPFDLIGTSGDRYAYELEARHYLAEWGSGRPSHPAELLASILTTSFQTAPRFPARLGRVLEHLERLAEPLIGLVAPTPPPPIRSTLWPQSPDRTQLSRLAPAPPKKGSLALTRATVFSQVGEELLGFLRVRSDWTSQLVVGTLEASARLAISIERPLEWAHIGAGDPHIAYPGSGVSFGRQRFTLCDVEGWCDQSHIHLIVLGPEDHVLRVFQVPMGPEPNSHSFDDPSGWAQFSALRCRRIRGDTPVRVEVALGRADIETNPAASLRHLAELKEAKRRASRRLLATEHQALMTATHFDAATVPPLFLALLEQVDQLLDQGRLDEVTALSHDLAAQFGSDVLPTLVLAHAELRAGADRRTYALLWLWGLIDPSAASH